MCATLLEANSLVILHDVATYIFAWEILFLTHEQGVSHSISITLVNQILTHERFIVFLT